MATIAAPVMTWEAFEQLPDSDGFHRELIKGELQVLPPAKSRHSKIAKAIFKLLLPLEESGNVQVFLEAGYKLSDHPPTWVQPDASVLSADRADTTGEDEHFLGAPNLAVEIISPSESATDIEQKIALLLAASCQTAWVLYPKTQTVHVFAPGGYSHVCSMEDTLPQLPFAPDWRVTVAQFFAD